MHAEIEGDVNLAIVRVEQAGEVVRNRFNQMRTATGYDNMPSNQELVDDLHALVNHLMVARGALERIQSD